MKVLIIKRDKIGDMLLTTPILKLLRQKHPQATLHVLANDYNAWVLDGNPDVDEVIVYPRVRHDGRLRLGAIFSHLALTRRLKRERYDYVVIANGGESPRAIRRGLSYRPGKLLAYVESERFRHHPALQAISSNKRHESERMLQLFAPLGLDGDTPLPPPRLNFSPAQLEVARQWLATWQQGAPDNFIIIGLGARRRQKQPSAEQVRRWADAALQRWGTPTVVVWTPGQRDNPLYPGDDELVAPLLAAPQPHIRPYSGSLQTVIGLIGLSRASLFPDSGLMHIASAAPGGVVGLFADRQNSADPDRWGPLGDRAIVLEAPHSVAELEDEAVLAAMERHLRP